MFRDIVREASNLIVPVSCVSCGLADTLWCGECRSAPTRPHEPQLAWRQALWGLPVRAVTDYDGPWRAAIIVWKDRGVHRLSREFAPHLAALIDELGFHHPIALVPVPGSWSGWFRRGVEPARELARHAAHHLAAHPADVVMVPGLVRRRWPGPGSFTSARRRKARTRQQRLTQPPSYQARSLLRGQKVVLVDDVLTTGATLEQAARVIQAAGGQVVGAVVLAATPR